MHKFVFNNEALPPSENIHDFIPLFSETLVEFNKLANEDSLNIEKGIITEKTPSYIHLGEFSLQEVIENINDNILRRIAYSYFTKHPIGNEIKIDREEFFLRKDYFINVGTKEYESLYLSYAADLRGFAFTTGIHSDLRKDILILIPRDGTEPVSLNNLYGEAGNTSFIEERIKEINSEGLSHFERLMLELDDPIYAKSFEKEFFKLTNDEQESIVDLFIRAKGRELTTPFYPDTKIISDVTPNNPKCNVYELRVYTPTALRVYFNEGEEKNYLASICKKSNPDQNKDINKAHRILYKLILTDT